MPTITDLTNTQWKLQSTLTGSNLPSSTYWEGLTFSINAELDGLSFGGFAYIKTIQPSLFGRDEITAASCPSGILVACSTEQINNIPNMDQFLSNCAAIGIEDFQFTDTIRKAFYFSLSVTTDTGSATLNASWSDQITNRVLTIYGGNDVQNTALINWLQNNADYMGMVNPFVPKLAFDPLQIGEPYHTGSTRVSYGSRANKVKFTFQSSTPFTYAMARVNRADAGDPTRTSGVLATQLAGSYMANTSYNIIVPVNETTFVKQTGDPDQVEYVVAIYVKDGQDGTWSETLFFLTVDTEQVITSAGSIFEVLDKDPTVLPYDTAERYNDNINVYGAQGLSRSDDEVTLSNS